MWSTFRPNDKYRNSDRTFSPALSFVYKNGVRMNIRAFNRLTYLYDDFDPTGLNPENPIPGARIYEYNSIKFSYNSDARKKFNFILRT